MPIVGHPGALPDAEVLKKLYEKLGYSFSDTGLLVRAMTHTSYANEHAEAGRDNERLEFLGDAVLDLALGQLLMSAHPDFAEGELSKLRASAVNETQLAAVARDLKLGEFLLLGRGEEGTGGRDKDSVLADLYEACLGAIFLDGGFEAARDSVTGHFASILSTLTPATDNDYKTRLQELTQAQFKTMPVYQLTGEIGPDHDKTFEVQLLVDGVVRGVGTGKSKKEAEQHAAYKALGELGAGRAP